ncbi:hypothetical protein ACF09J_26200 [Streptomyces sp. NPDC014889]|uniref:hypothetical protein n=1 Tax=Streptomyces sp. NPDC014889 TaxID=3364928 RepID=UPI0036FB608C
MHALDEAWATTGTGSQLDSVMAPEANVTGTAPWSIDVTGLVMGWTDGANANYGLALRRPEDAPRTAGISFTSATLAVDYQAATPPSVPTAVPARGGDRGPWSPGEPVTTADTATASSTTR